MDAKLQKKKSRNDGLKYCGCCKKEKTTDLFYNLKSSKDGKGHYCKDCQNKKRSVSYHKNKHSRKKRTPEQKEELRLYAIEYRKKWRERDLKGFREYASHASRKHYQKKKEQQFNNIIHIRN